MWSLSVERGVIEGLAQSLLSFFSSVCTPSSSVTRLQVGYMQTSRLALGYQLQVMAAFDGDQLTAKALQKGEAEVQGRPNVGSTS